MLIRPARPDEAEELSALAFRSKAHWGYDEEFLAACRGELTYSPGDLAARRATVAVLSGTIVGFYTLDGSGDLELGNLWVDPARLGHGIGRKLWEHAVAAARSYGSASLSLDADPHAEGFYLAMGAVRVGDTQSTVFPGRVLPRMRFAWNLAARFHAARDVRLAAEPMPSPGAGESLVRITAVGLCGSDLHWYSEGGIGDARIGDPIVGGHEMAGVVEGGPLHGVRVAVDPAIPCHRCDMCRRGHPNLCRALHFAGHATRDGGLQRYLAWPTDRLHPLPDTLTDADGAMLEPLGVAVHAVDLGHVPLGGSVAVIGCGPIGLLMIQVARAAGAGRVLAADPLAHRRAAAAARGADVVLDPAAGAYASQLNAFTDGLGADVAFEIAGTDPAIAAAMDAVRPGGRVVLAGIPDGELSAFPASVARRKGLTIVMVRRMKEVYPRATALVEAGLVDVRGLVSHRFPLTAVNEAFSTAVARTGLKVVVSP